MWLPGDRGNANRCVPVLQWLSRLRRDIEAIRRRLLRVLLLRHLAVTANPNRLVGPKMKKDGTVSGAALLIRMWKTLTFLLDPQSHEPQVAILVYEQKY